VNVYFSVGPDGEFSVSHFQGGGGPVLTWLPFITLTVLPFIYIKGNGAQDVPLSTFYFLLNRDVKVS
jgi:hypothetical protein